MLYSLARPLLFSLSAERSHDLTLEMLRRGAGKLYPGRVPARPVEVMGLTFANPVGLAAGLDKNGDCIDGLAELGFGFLEVGTVTPRPQPGNPTPRLFRLPPRQALINRMGFNNHGVDALVENVRASRYRGVLGINIGKNKDTPVEQAVDDYLLCQEKVHALAGYLVVNVSSPNTPGLRTLQHGDALDRLLGTLREAQTRLDQRHGKRVPLVIKIAPDNSDDELWAMAQAFVEHGIDGVCVGNTTLQRPGVERLQHGGEQGGLSGAPLAPIADHALETMAMALERRIPIIGVGGILNADDARRKQRLGADLVQVYSGLIYQGPGLIGELVRGW
ncbi:quinone-dependent dihydroorotate dehydrogenase [Alloalcanivorax mobilis]|uniref:quinone-dependent dihydroorotate dehydrogenase n=1 Tax=Alloalcanivorax mobilis TaxID=2019569 RepID=UPI000B5B3ED1|nr:quinone-dependent dihydroorotate dehydrogenase [Alloalcanivorax mobilis]ASK34233.1 dihydroorotate dehydrogenase (quinone) [Alcanivorax sp. N3-2A]|tara:strand:- start:18572 stop:19570 length:999 start_codon:yes stop_codon:yes gene_type:complete